MKLRIRTAFAVIVGGLVSLAGLPAHAAPLGSYIVVLNDTVNVRTTAPELARTYGLEVGFLYEHALRGISARIPEWLVTALQADPRVKYVEPDRVRSIDAQTIPTGINRIFAASNAAVDIDGTDDWRVDADIAVIDTGVDLQHPDLNVAGGVTCVTGNCKTGGDDDNSHGTHVAGTIGALDNDQYVAGVAPGARLWSVKVLNRTGTGYSSWIIAGINWVAANAGTIEVANMSLGGSGYSQAEYDAIQGAVNKGVAFAVAAGNADADARAYSPAAFDNVLAVSALADFDGVAGGLGTPTCRTDQDDTLADFSSWGTVVDVVAPGVCILSTLPLENGGSGVSSGTSMASPHVAGALALLASARNPATAADVRALYDTIRASGNLAWTDDSGDRVKEPLLDVSGYDPVMVGEGTEPPGNQAPTASFTASVSGLTATFTDTSTDPDGTIASRRWDFGDGSTASTANPSHTYGTAGTFTVSLTVTDDDAATATTSQQVTVTAPSAITLEATTRVVRRTTYVDLRWSGATGRYVDTWRNSTRISTTNDGVHSDKLSSWLPRTLTYKVCNSGTTTCSPVVTISW